MRFYPLVILLLLLCNPAQAKTLLVLGDSLSAAYGMSPQQGWVNLLQQRLSDEFFEVDVVNASISGDTLSGGLSRLPALLDRHQPDYIVLELAANDGLRGGHLNVIEANLNKLVSLAKSKQAKVVLVGVQLPPNYGPRYTKSFFALFPKVAQNHAVALVPFLMDKVALQSQLMQADGLHPNAQAQPQLLDNVWPILQPLLSDTAKQ